MANTERMAAVKENLSIKDAGNGGGEDKTRFRIVVAIDINLLQQGGRTT